jgi:hypothetical protein
MSAPVSHTDETTWPVSASSRASRKVLVASAHSILDFSNGASVVTLDVLHGLCASGFECRAFCTPKLDLQKGARLEHVLDDSRERYQVLPAACGTERARILYTQRSHIPITVVNLDSSPQVGLRPADVHTVLCFFRSFLEIDQPDVMLTYGGDPITNGRLTEDDLPGLELGNRAFEIFMARQLTDGGPITEWFQRHSSVPITEIPTHWPAAYRKLVERRIKLIETNKEIALIEKPEYKRRWNDEPWEDQQERALKNWLLDRLETPKYQKSTKENPELTTTAQMADVASADAEFLQVAALYRGRPDFNVAALVAELVEAEAVPFLPILRYKPTGLRKREIWERTWDLQRQEDKEQTTNHTNHTNEENREIQPNSDSSDFISVISVIRGSNSVALNSGASTSGGLSIPVPPKYTSADFLKTDYWRLRGKLDVPKERWISYPYCSTESDPTLVVVWAGWNHLQQATALVAYYDAHKREGWDAKRLTPLLAGLDQLLPWIHQWHPEIDKEFGETAGQSFQTMLEHDAHELGLTLEDIRNWQPPEKTRKTRTTHKKKAVPADEAEE